MRACGYEKLAVFLKSLQSEPAGEWIIDRMSNGTTDDPITMPFVELSRNTHRFIEAAYAFENEHPNFGLNRYSDILKAPATGRLRDTVREVCRFEYVAECAMKDVS